jgi:hypothetical protein
MLELSNPATNIFHFRESAKKKKVMYKLEKHISEAIKIKKREIISGKVKLTKIVSRDRLPKIEKSQRPGRTEELYRARVAAFEDICE